MGTVLFLIIWPLDTALSVTPYPSVFSRFGPLGALTVVRFPPPPFFDLAKVFIFDFLRFPYNVSIIFCLFVQVYPVFEIITLFS